MELKWKLDGKSIANFLNKNTIFPHKIIIVHLPDLSFLCYIYLLSNLPPLYVVYLFITHWIILVDKSYFQNGAAHANDGLTSGFVTGVFWQI